MIADGNAAYFFGYFNFGVGIGMGYFFNAILLGKVASYRENKTMKNNFM
jgi:hypothetical protein